MAGEGTRPRADSTVHPIGPGADRDGLASGRADLASCVPGMESPPLNRPDRADNSYHTP